MRYLLPVVSLLMTSLAARATNWYVQAGQSLQPIIKEALPGDTITLQAGATFVGNFFLPNKSGTSWITIQSSMMSSLPVAGQRVRPSQAPFMARLMSPNGAATLYVKPGAHNYNLVGLELASLPGTYTQN